MSQQVLHSPFPADPSLVSGVTPFVSQPAVTPKALRRKRVPPELVVARAVALLNSGFEYHVWPCRPKRDAVILSKVLAAEFKLSRGTVLRMVRPQVRAMRLPRPQVMS